MRIYNIIDELGRFKGYKVEFNNGDGQYNTHTYSYFYARQELSRRFVMGFDSEEFQEKISELEQKIKGDEK